MNRHTFTDYLIRAQEKSADKRWENIRQEFNTYCNNNGIDQAELSYHLLYTLKNANKGKKIYLDRLQSFLVHSKMTDGDEVKKEHNREEKFITYKADVDYKIERSLEQMNVDHGLYLHTYRLIKNKQICGHPTRKRNFTQSQWKRIQDLLRVGAVRKTIFGNIRTVNIDPINNRLEKTSLL